MKNILLITYLMPPYGGIIPLRNSIFARLIKNHGYNPIVLTTKYDSRSLFDHDKSLLKEIENVNLKIIKINSWEPVCLYNLLKKLRLNKLRTLLASFFIPDSKIFWIIPAIITGFKLIRTYNIKLIFTSSNPYSINFIGWILARLTKLPWVADYKDPWIRNFIRIWPTKIHYLIEKNMEKLLYHRATRLIVSTPLCRKELLEDYSTIAPDKVNVGTNGYIAEEFLGITPVKNSEFTLIYVGRSYVVYETKNRTGILVNIAKRLRYKISPLDYNSLTPYYLLKGISCLIEKHPDVKIKLKFIGPLYERHRELIDELNLSKIIEATDYMQHSVVIKSICSADLLLYILGYSKRPLYTVASRLYEYMASKKPILALIPEGDSMDFLKKSGLGIFADPRNSSEISDRIYELYKKWENGNLKSEPNDKFIRQFERKKIIADYAKIFDETLKSPKRQNSR